MQELLVVKTRHGFELYCAMCNNLFSEEFVKMDIPYFCDIHRHIHKQMSLDTPDLPDNLPDYPSNSIELSTANQDLSTENLDLSTTLSTKYVKLSTDTSY